MDVSRVQHPLALYRLPAVASKRERVAPDDRPTAAVVPGGVVAVSALLFAAALIAAVLAYLHWPLWLTVPTMFVCYVVHSIFRDNARCWKCKGSPRHYSSSGRTWRDCWVCGGSGKRKRWGKKWFDSAMSNRNT